VVTLYTKAECTLCDKVKEVLKTVAADAPHSLVQVLRARVHTRAPSRALVDNPTKP